MPLCILVVDYSGSMPTTVRDAFLELYKNACFARIGRCSISTTWGAVVHSKNHVFTPFGSSGNSAWSIAQYLMKESPRGPSFIVEALADVFNRVASDTRGLRSTSCLVVFLTDAQQQVPWRRIAVENIPCKEVVLVIVLFKGKRDCMHSHSEFAKALSELLAPLSPGDQHVFKTMLEVKIWEALSLGRPFSYTIGRISVRILLYPERTRASGYFGDTCSILRPRPEPAYLG